jgi:hypothetical protein
MHSGRAKYSACEAKEVSNVERKRGAKPSQSIASTWMMGVAGKRPT